MFTDLLDFLGVTIDSPSDAAMSAHRIDLIGKEFIVQVNDCVLKTLGSSWDDTLPLPSQWVEKFADSPLLLDIRNYLQSEFTQSNLVALNDPRLCKVLPLWMPLFLTHNVKLHAVLIVRNPWDVASSLASRYNFSTQKSLLLWMQHMINAERHSRHLARAFITVESLVDHPSSTIHNVFNLIGLPSPCLPDEHFDLPTGLVDFSFQYSGHTDNDAGMHCPEFVTSLYRLLYAIAETGQTDANNLEVLDEIYRQFEASQSFFYNRDTLQPKATDVLQLTSDLESIKSSFERDKIYREYRYIANTTHLYKENEQLRASNEHYKSGKQASPHFGITLSRSSVTARLYETYQGIVELVLPQGTSLRRMLQQSKRMLFSLSSTNASSENTESPCDVRKSENSLNAYDEPPTVPADFMGRRSAHAPDENTSGTSGSPIVSIIIYISTTWQVTAKCLHSIFEHTSGNFEVIVIKNQLADEDLETLATTQSIRVIANEVDGDCVNAYNQAATLAKGKYLLLLKDTTEITEGWLEALLEPFSDSRTGIVGAKLLNPNGSLQEAGGILWRDGHSYSYGHGENPDLPQYTYRRAVDYCSGTCLMIPLSLWERVGGMDRRYSPGFYEDRDLCFSVYALGFNVIFQPTARVIHSDDESLTREPLPDHIQLQAINRNKFVEKWAQALKEQHTPGPATLFKARERTSNKHILVIDHRCPTFDRDSGSLRMLNMLQILQELGYTVAFWPDDLAHDAKYTRKLQDLGIETFYGDLDFEAYIAEHGDKFDVVLLSRPVTAKKYLQLVKKYSNAQTIFDTVDLHFVRERRRLELEVAQWKNLEFFLAEEADTTFVVSPTELEILSNERFSNKLAVISNIHSLEPCTKSYSDREGLMFIGGFAHPPNEEGIIWFIDYILPVIRRQLPGIHLTIVGSDPSERLKAMASSQITVTGYVEDVSSYFNNCRVFVSPLRHGAGVKGKIGQSFSFGLPVVTTSIGAEGMQLIDGHNALISDSETEFARKVVDLYTDKFLWHRLSTNGRQVINEQFSADTVRVALAQALEKGATNKQRGKKQPRPVIIHCHLFKNAGTTLDWSLNRQFGPGFVDHRDDEDMRRGAAYLGPYITAHPEVQAISSHHVRFPLPTSIDFQPLPVLALRHPIDRARSVYEFERRQDSDTPGARHAKALSFPEYVRWRLNTEVAPTIRNFHCSFCTGEFTKQIGEQQYLDSVSLLAQLPLLIIVEHYDECMLLLEKYLYPYFPRIDLSYVRQNASPGRVGSLGQRVAAVNTELGAELSREFQKQNHWDMMLYNDAVSIMHERLGALGNLDKLLANFRSRCEQLTSG